MGLAEEYRRQYGWRSWRTALDALPALEGRKLLDLGCGVGDLAADLAARGARVIGVDLQEELLDLARARGIPGAVFLRADLRAPLDPGGPVDGIWASFTAAYFPDLAPTLARWTAMLRAGGWIALTEIDDLFAHEPLDSRTRALLDAYANEALDAGRYDFRMGRKLRAHLERAGFQVEREIALDDLELAFDGPAREDVLEAWRARFERMTLLRERCGERFEAVRDDFLRCLARPEHRSRAAVSFCLARRSQAKT